MMVETKKKKSATGTAKKAGAKPRKREPAITMQDALQIAQAYLADKGAFSISGIVDGIPEEFEAYFTASEPLAAALKDCWIVECGLDPFLVVDGGTMLIGVSKTTGDILYAGILSKA
jgi:hypothetical protein